MTTESPLLSIIPPPAGEVSNFVNPPTIAGAITVSNIICLSLSVIAVAVRMYTRSRLVGSVGADDYLLLIAMVFAICSTSTMQTEIKYGLGKHAWDVPLTDFSPSLLQLWMAGSILYSAAMLFVKLSFLYLYKRIFADARGFFLPWWLVLIVVVGYSVAGMFTSLLTCIPIAMAWDLNITNGVCINKAAFYIANACLNVVTDLAILALPIRPIWRTSFSRRQKIMLCLLFGTGSFTCIVSMIRIKYIVDLLKFGDQDLTQVIVPTVVWTIIEMHCAIICACAATLKPFIQRYFGCLISGSQPSQSKVYISSRQTFSSKPTPLSTRKTLSFSQSRSDAHAEDDMEMDALQKLAANQSWYDVYGTSITTDCRGPSLESQEVILQQDNISITRERKMSEIQVTKVVDVSHEEKME